MDRNDANLEGSKFFSNWYKITEWARGHFRDRIFAKDDRIPTRSGLLYLVEKGVVRLVSKGKSFTSIDNEAEWDEAESPHEMFLGFVSEGQPFEVVEHSHCNLEVYAQVDGTKVIWLYWHDIDNWLNFRRELLEVFRYKQRRQTIALNVLAQRSTIDRLMGFLTLTIEECGILTESGYCLPYSLTHAQISSAIGSTRVTVTRLLGQLRRSGAIAIRDDNLICLPK